MAVSSFFLLTVKEKTVEEQMPEGIKMCLSYMSLSMITHVNMTAHNLDTR